MPAAWTRVSPVTLETLALPKGGAMLMLTAAKKHLTIFKRTRRCRIKPGRPAVKEVFKKVAHTTLDIPERSKRIKIVKEGVLAAGLKTGIFYKRSRGKGPKLYGKFYMLEGKETVSSAIARKGLEKVLVEAPTAGR
jgi:hypothetical protein